MAESGTLIVRAFLSLAQFPVSDATVIVSAPDEDGRQRLLSVSRTNESGVAGPIMLDAPEVSGSTTPGSSAAAFASYTLIVEHPDYQLALFDDVQIFPGIETVQDVPMIPLSENGQNESERILVTPQPL